MRRFRITIAGMLKVVVFLSVAFAALREATERWDGGVLGLTLLTLLTAVLLAVHRRERGRALWLGFALFGWAYLIATLVPTIEARLPTTKGLAYLDSLVPGRSLAFTVTLSNPGGTVLTGSTVPTPSPDGSTRLVNQQGTIRLWTANTGRLVSGPNGNTESFVRIGHSLMALILGILGGWLSRRLYDAGRPCRVEGPGDPPFTARSSNV